MRPASQSDLCLVRYSDGLLADFEAAPAAEREDARPEEHPLKAGIEAEAPLRREFDLNLSYTINLVLPKTDDAAVFNAIFKSLRENLLRK